MLPIYLCEEGQIKKAYASDNKEGPLTIAKNNIAVYGLSNKISTLKSDGIKDISSDILNGDEEAKNQLLLSYLKYPIIMAKRCAKDIDEFKDYLHAGNLALFESLESFSYKKGACFTRYLNFQIRKEITKVIADR